MEPSGSSTRDGWDPRADMIPARTATAIPLPRPLLVYTALSIVAGVVALAWATLALPLEPGIALAGVDGRAGLYIGLLFWVGFGLLGGAWVASIDGHGVLTFHLPFIVGATALGGPVAGGWVAMLSTSELREFRQAPWFGALSNHAVLALAAVVAGATLDRLRPVVDSTLGDQAQLAELVAVLGCALVFSIISRTFVLGTVVLRDRLTVRDAFGIFAGSFRSEEAGEGVMAWLLAALYTFVAWWGSLVCAVLVLVLWRRGPRSFDEQVERAVSRARRGLEGSAYMLIDLDHFGAVNERHGPAVADQILHSVERLLAEHVRRSDVVGPRSADTFRILLLGMSAREVARAKAHEIRDAIAAAAEMGGPAVEVTATVGIAMIADDVLGSTQVYQRSEQALDRAKRTGEGVIVWEPQD